MKQITVRITDVDYQKIKEQKESMYLFCQSAVHDKLIAQRRDKNTELSLRQFGELLNLLNDNLELILTRENEYQTYREDAKTTIDKINDNLAFLREKASR